MLQKVFLDEIFDSKRLVGSKRGGENGNLDLYRSLKAKEITQLPSFEGSTFQLSYIQ